MQPLPLGTSSASNRRWLNDCLAIGVHGRASNRLTVRLDRTHSTLLVVGAEVGTVRRRLSHWRVPGCCGCGCPLARLALLAVLLSPLQLILLMLLLLLVWLWLTLLPMRCPTRFQRRCLSCHTPAPGNEGPPRAPTHRRLLHRHCRRYRHHCCRCCCCKTSDCGQRCIC
jgi:hypothetical protein